MANKNNASDGTIGSWAKRCYFAGRALMDQALRPHDLGATQWYVLYQLASHGPTMQRELVRQLQVERATLSLVVASLVRKELVEQVADAADKRQKLLRLTAAGTALWAELPDLGFIHQAAFGDIPDPDIATAIRVLRIATERLTALSKGTDQ